ncbi:MAG: DUF362 domain-containing protein [Desulfobacterales bacterium]|nr:DUF362 domain-containing protein [Desulfobacterales bacterium]
MTNQFNGAVAITKYDDSIGALQKGIDLIGGLEDLNPSDNILIKPNIVWSLGGAAPKYGLITTTRLIEDIIILLREKGCRKISIGEGSPVNKELGANTLKGFSWSGIGKIAKKHDVKLVDFNDAQVQIKLGKKHVDVARSAVESDFLINVPVLKTHAMTKVSLGMKNLKGCLSMKSKKKFHMLDLDEMIALLNTKIKPKLTVIDGIYAMEKGPLPSGRAHRMNLLITGRDVFTCDIVGSSVLGIDPATVEHLLKFSGISGKPIETESISVLGERIQDVCGSLEWQSDLESIYHLADMGITVQWPGNRFCTNCVICAGITFSCFCKDNLGVKIPPLEVCFGPDVKAKENSEKVLLIGDCAVRSNRSRKDAIKVEGCPPKIFEAMTTLMDNTLGKRRVKKILATRFLKVLLSKYGLYKERFPTQFPYKKPDFSPKHF